MVVYQTEEFLDAGWLEPEDVDEIAQFDDAYVADRNKLDTNYCDGVTAVLKRAHERLAAAARGE